MENHLRFYQSPSEMTLREFKFSLKLIYIQATTLLENKLALRFISGFAMAQNIYVTEQ